MTQTEDQMNIIIKNDAKSANNYSNNQIKRGKTRDGKRTIIKNFDSLFRKNTTKNQEIPASAYGAAERATLRTSEFMRRRKLPLPDELRDKVFNNIAVEDNASNFDQTTATGKDLLITSKQNSVEKFNDRSPGLRTSKDSGANQSPKLRTSVLKQESASKLPNDFERPLTVQ